MNGAWENLISTYRTLKSDLSLSPSTKIKYKWIKYLDIKPEILKLLEEKLGNKLQDIGIGHSGNKVNN